MTPQEEKQIEAWNHISPREIDIHLVLTEDERTRGFIQFCEDLSRLAPKIRILRKKEDAGKVPAIRITPSLVYEAIPSGTELEPFLEALSLVAKKQADIPSHIRGHLDKIGIPAALRLYVSPQCPFCPASVRQLVPLAFASEFVSLTVTDAELFPEMARSDNIQSIPALLLDEHFRWTGTVQTEEITDILAKRDPAEISAASMERMIIEGNVFKLAEMMTDRKTIFPAFVELLAHEHFTVRLGAMAAMEEIAEQDLKTASEVVVPLLEKFEMADAQVKGDILHILGESGGSGIILNLKKIAEGEYGTEVREAAKEAMEKIQERN